MNRYVLTANGDLPGGLHGRPVPVVRIAGHQPHVPRHVVDVGDHVAGDLAADGMTVQVEGDRGEGGAHGDAEDGHGATLQHHVHGVDGRGLHVQPKTNIMSPIMWRTVVESTIEIITCDYSG